MISPLMRLRKRLLQLLERRRSEQEEIAMLSHDTRAADLDHAGETAHRGHGARACAADHALLRKTANDGDL